MRTYAGRGIHGETVTTLGRRIASGYYKPGQLLYIDALGEELGISRTAIREALKVLAARGMVDSRPKRGTVVMDRSEWNLLDADLIAWQYEASPSLDFLRQLSEMRFIIEPEAARLAAARRDQDDLRQLREALDAMGAAGRDAEATILADLAFHRALLLATHNELLTQMEVVIEAGLRVRDQLVHGRGDWKDPLPEHEAVFAAVAAGKGDQASRAIRRLLDRALREAVELVEPEAEPVAAPPPAKRQRRTARSGR